MGNTKKIVHIHCDPKFISQMKKFQSPAFENKLIFLGCREDIPSAWQEGAVAVSPQKGNINKVVSECEQADLVVVYSLASLIPRIILRLPKSQKIAWRFFGYELYEKIPEKMLSPETCRILKEAGISRSYVDRIKGGILLFFPKWSSFNRSIKRIDYFLGFFSEEYELLRSFGFNLPPFLQIPLNGTENAVWPDAPPIKKPILLLGNSGSFFNNHIDIIRVLQKCKRLPRVRIKLIFSYGGSSHYDEVVKKEASKVPNIEFVERFLNISEFERIYQEAAALIINSYRQMALGNIFIALRTGTKIYLSEKNVTFHWLKEKQFKVFSVEHDLQPDLEESAFFLSREEAIHNYNKLVELRGSYTVEEFQRAIGGLIRQ